MTLPLTADQNTILALGFLLALVPAYLLIQFWLERMNDANRD